MADDWQRQELFRLINKRMEDGNITIYTSNMSTDSLNVDARTRDRIVKTSVELQMPEESIRRKKAASEQKEFLAGIIAWERNEDADHFITSEVVVKT